MAAPRQPVFNLPGAVSGLFTALLALHLVRVLLPPRLDDQVISRFGFIPARVSAWLQPPLSPADSGGEGAVAVLVTFVTHMFIHADWFHVGLNALWLLPFGAAVARRLGSDVPGQLSFFAVFLVSGAAGALAHLTFYPEVNLPLAGASGGVSGMMGAATRVMFSAGAFYSGRFVPLSPLSDSRVIIFAAVFVLINLVFGNYGVDFGVTQGAIAWQAHVGGFFAGLLLFPLFDRRLTLPPGPPRSPLS